MDSLECTISSFHEQPFVERTVARRVCGWCGEEKPFTEFRISGKQCLDCKRKATRLYRQTHKEAKRVHDQRHRAKHREKRRLKDAQYYRDNREKCLAVMARGRQKNPEKRQAYSRAYRLANLEQCRAANRTYRLEHQEQLRASRKKYYGKYPMSALLGNIRRRARKRSLPDTFSKDDLHFMLTYWHHACAVCGNQRGFFWTLQNDHWIPITDPRCPGTIATNMVPLCGGEGGCNNSKNKYDPHTWLMRRYGARKASVIEQRITTYFALVAARFSHMENSA